MSRLYVLGERSCKSLTQCQGLICQDFGTQTLATHSNPPETSIPAAAKEHFVPNFESDVGTLANVLAAANACG